MNKTTLFAGFAVVVLIHSGYLGAQSCRPPDAATRAEIEEVHQRDAQASRQTGAAARQAILDLLTDDVVVLAPGSPPVKGKGAWAKVLEQSDSAASDWVIDSYVETYPELVVCGDTAFEWGSITTEAHSLKSGPRNTGRQQHANSPTHLERQLADSAAHVQHPVIFVKTTVTARGCLRSSRVVSASNRSAAARSHPPNPLVVRTRQLATTAHTRRR